MTNTKVVLAALIVALTMAGRALAQELDGTLKKIKATSALNLGYLTSALPFSFPGPDKRPVDYSIDLCTHVASAIQKQLGVNLKLNRVPVTTENRRCIPRQRITLLSAPFTKFEIQRSSRGCSNA